MAFLFLCYACAGSAREPIGYDLERTADTNEVGRGNSSERGLQMANANTYPTDQNALALPQRQAFEAAVFGNQPWHHHLITVQPVEWGYGLVAAQDIEYVRHASHSVIFARPHSLTYPRT